MCVETCTLYCPLGNEQLKTLIERHSQELKTVSGYDAATMAKINEGHWIIAALTTGGVVLCIICFWIRRIVKSSKAIEIAHIFVASGSLGSSGHFLLNS